MIFKQQDRNNMNYPRTMFSDEKQSEILIMIAELKAELSISNSSLR